MVTSLTTIANSCFNVKRPEDGGVTMTASFGGPAVSGITVENNSPTVSNNSKLGL